jgi:heme/copper-type cytochrome/quinol oxidase subunit 4
MDHNYHYANLLTGYPLFSFVFVFSFVFFLYFTILFLYLATKNRKEGEIFIPDSLLVLCISVKLVSVGSIVITNQHEQAFPIPGL